MKKSILSAILISLGLTGCVGITTVANTERVSRPAETESDRSDVCPGKIVGEYISCSGTPTKAEFRNAWGEPSAITKHGKTEEWTYSRDLALRGAWIHAGVPIPLLIPTGMNHEYLTFWHEKLIERKSESGDIGYQGMCSLIPNRDQCFSQSHSSLGAWPMVNGLDIGSHSQADLEEGIVADLDVTIPAKQTWQVCIPTEIEGEGGEVKVTLSNETFTKSASADLCYELIGTGKEMTLKIGMQFEFIKPIKDKKSFVANMPTPVVTFTEFVFSASKLIDEPRLVITSKQAG